ncbi:MAG: chromosome segregation protein SMC [Deltaproteobacteria bacterium]|nr:chromosome segregation protein SMC [Deltaproteobacteria bacterium]
MADINVRIYHKNMKIKKIEIQGFKSFVDKTIFHFPKGVTAVVGPNGCGKSNIVDAIRWVLGEQNARHLRGKLMEDIIFAGSESRKPIGAAEVVLTLSNEEGLAPQEYANFTEIEISRKLFRSGESEYCINRVESRLKDIVDLFTDTGIGTRAYSIIEQGQVGWLVTAKPEERRMLFEEAAGINKYKHRKDAALRRLEATKENLTRVSDIVSEVKRQLNSLNRQAKKAERFKILRDELKGIELFLASEEYIRLKNNKTEAEKRLQDLKDRDIEISTLINQKQGILEEMRTRHLQQEIDLKEIRTRMFDAGNAIQTREREIELSRIRIAELKRNEERLLKEIDELNSQRQGTANEIGELKNTIEEISNIIKTEGERLIKEEGNLSMLSEKLSQKDRDLKDKKTSIADIMARVLQIKNSIHIYLRDEDVLNLKTGKLEREKNEIDAVVLSKEKIVNELNEKIKEAGNKKQDIEKIEQSTVEQIKDMEQRLVQMDAEQKAQKQELAASSSRLATLEELERNFEGFKDGIKAIMQTKRLAPEGSPIKDFGDKFNQGEEGGYGILGIIADIIETSPQYEKAVEAVMGERLQYIIVDGQNNGISAIEYLKTNALGRGSFVPLREIPNQAAKNDAQYTNASPMLNHLKIKDGYSSLVNYLLADVLVANNLKEAIEIWNSNGMDKTIVTLEGDVIDGYGVITGGNGKGGDSGILQKKREIRELSSAVAEIEQKIIGLDIEIEKLKNETDGSKKGLETLKTTRHSKDMELVNLEADFKREESELDRLKQRMNIVGFEIDESKRHLKEILDKKTEMAKERESLEIIYKEVEAGINSIELEVSNLLKEKEVLQSLATEIKVNLASSRERLDGLKLQHMEKERFIGEVADRIDAKKTEIEKGAMEITDKESNASKIQEEVEGLLRQKDEIKKEEIIKEEALNAALMEIQGIENKLKSMKHEIDAVHENINAANLEIKELEMKSSHLSSRISEKYNIAVDAYIPDEDIKAMEGTLVTARCEELKSDIASLGEVSLSALEEYAELERRQQFLMDQQTDLNNSIETLNKAVNRINRTTRQRFKETFDAINAKFQEVFPVFFPGGRAELRLVDEGNLLESGIEIVSQPQGKRLQSISLLSGGEKAMTATALIFSIFLIKPSPFCLLDEVDAPLDDANINRFNVLLKEMAKKSQFILITHNKGTMEIADTLFGITMEEAGISKTVSVQLN